MGIGVTLYPLFLMGHKFTHDEAVAAGKKRAAMPDFQEHQEEAFEKLKAMRPDCWRWIYRNRVKPYMQERYPNGKTS